MKTVFLVITTLLLSACAANGQQAEQVVIAPLGSGDTFTSGMTREELEDSVRRYSDRYFTRIALATNNIRYNTDSQQIKRFMHDWKTVSYASGVEIAIGPNAVTNLLDMMAMTRLSRLVVESYWIPEILGEELGAELGTTYIDLEKDIWTVADGVLTQQHQVELEFLVDQWHAENPEQIYPWYVRLRDFSGQRAASLAAMQRSGGLLKEVARAREAAEEIQAFGERVLFYLQRAPALTTNEFESSVGGILGGPEVTRLIDDTDRFVVALERFVQILDQLPDHRLIVVDQLMDRVAEERREIFQDLSTADPAVRAILTDLQPLLESLERIIVIAKTRNPDAEPFDIDNYTEIISEAAMTATELRLLLQSVSNLLGDTSAASSLVGVIVEAERDIANRLFLQIVALFVIFFVLLLAYRFVAHRMFPGQ